MYFQVNAENGEVKLSGACLPRTAKLPENMADSVSSDFVYLPREILNGGVYVANCDIYCFAILCLELHANPPLRVFEEERLWPLETFRSFDSSPIFLMKLRQAPFQMDFIQYLRRCLDVDALKRPSALELWNERNRKMEKKTRRYGAVNGTYAVKHLWSSHRAQQKLKS